MLGFPVGVNWWGILPENWTSIILRRKRGKTHEVKGCLFHSVRENDGNLNWKFRDFEFTVKFFPQNCHKKCSVHNRGNKTASKNSDNNLLTIINEIMYNFSLSADLEAK